VQSAKPPNDSANKPKLTAKLELNVSSAGRSVLHQTLNSDVAEDEDEPSCSLQNVDFLIATVPDPSRTHLSLVFDRELEAVMSAAEDSGYDFDRFWLPWRTETVPETADPDLRKRNAAEKEKRESMPGLLFFREDSDPTKALAVFLVGETPTDGVDRHQFQKAADYIHRFSPTQKLMILGPTFSGAFPSLDRAIKEDTKKSPKEVVVRTGTATSQGALRGFQEEYPDFFSTVQDDCQTYGALRKWLDNDSVAILTEDGTAYGRPAGDCESVGKPEASFFYPREISLLRNAYQNDPVLAAARKNGNVDAVRRQLLLPLADSQTGRDTLPQFSAEQSPITQEAQLFQIAEALKRGRFAAVLLTGSNVLDTLFLSHFLRESCPDMRIIVLDSDLLFIHGTDSADYTGILAASTYPLIGPSGARKRSFTSKNAAGAYNATLLLLQGIPTDPKNPPSAPLLDYAPPSCAQPHGPPVWISVVGRGFYWPVAALSPSAAPTLARESNATPNETPADLATPTRLWSALFVACSALALIYAGICGYAKQNAPLLRWCSDFNPAPDPQPVTAGRPTYHLLTTLMLLLSYCALGLAPMYLTIRGQFTHWYDWPLQGTVAILTIVVLTFIAGITLPLLLPESLKLAVVLAFAALVIGGLFAMLLQRDGAGFFFFLRSVNVPSGVAPTLPLLMLFLAFCWWAWSNLQRFIFMEERDPFRPGTLAPTFPPIAEIQDSLAMPLFLGDPTGYLAFVVALVSVLMVSFRFRSLEAASYDWYVLALLFLGGSLLLGTAYGYFQLWCRLRRFLETLDLMPIRDAFFALPSVSTWSPLWQPSARKRSYTILERSVETLTRLATLNPTYYPGLAARLAALKTTVTNMVIGDRVANGEREAYAEIEAVNTLANATASNLEPVLYAPRGPWASGSSETLDNRKKGAHKYAGTAVWQAPAVAIDVQAKTGPDDGDVPNTLAAEFIALRYIAFIRYVMLQLQNQLSYLSGGFILITIAVNCYPFRGGNYFRWWLTIGFLIIFSIVVKVFFEMERDATLSRLTDSPAGKIGGEFYMKVISAGALPLLTVLASHFPTVGRFLFSWVQPALSALH